MGFSYTRSDSPERKTGNGIAPRLPGDTAAQTIFHSLNALFTDASPLYRETVTSVAMSPDSERAYHVMPLVSPFHHWLKDCKGSEYDVMRCEDAIEKGSGVDTWEPLREWNDELQCVRETPCADYSQRERNLFKSSGDFAALAVSGAINVRQSRILPIVALEACSSQPTTSAMTSSSPELERIKSSNCQEEFAHNVFIWNNILFLQTSEGDAPNDDDPDKSLPHDLCSRKGVRVDMRALSVFESVDSFNSFSQPQPGLPAAVPEKNTDQPPDLHTMAHCLVDYAGTRVLAQSIIPGLLNGDINARPAFGATDSKDKFVFDQSVFELLERRVARYFALKTHTVKDAHGTSVKVQLPFECKVLRGADGRLYLTDVCRLCGRDMNFPTNTSSSHVLRPELLSRYIRSRKCFEGIADSSSSQVAAKEVVTPPTIDTKNHAHSLLSEQMHHYNWLALLGLKQFYLPDDDPSFSHIFFPFDWEKNCETQLQQFFKPTEGQIRSSNQKAADDTAENAKLEKEASASPSDTATESSTSGPNSECPQASDSSPENIEEGSSVQRVRHADVKQETVKGIFPTPMLNVDVGTTVTLDMPEDEIENDTNVLNDMAAYLRDEVVVSLANLLMSNNAIPLESTGVTALFHRFGINMRYLGAVIKECEKLLTGNPDRCLVIDVLKREIVIRSAIHVINKEIRDLPIRDLATASSYLLNCLMWEEFMELKRDSSFADLPSTLKNINGKTFWTSIVERGSGHFKYDLPKQRSQCAAITSHHGRYVLLRTVCVKVGIQLVPESVRDMLQPLIAPWPETSRVQEVQETEVELPKTSPTNVDHYLEPDDIADLVPVMKSPPLTSVIVRLLMAGGVEAHAHERLDEALHCYQQAIFYLHQFNSVVRTDTAVCFAAIGKLFSSAGDVQPAIEHFQKALIVYERCLGVDSPETIELHSSLAMCLLAAAAELLGAGVANIEDSDPIFDQLRRAHDHVSRAVDLTRLWSGTLNPDLAVRLMQASRLLTETSLHLRMPEILKSFRPSQPHPIVIPQLDTFCLDIAANVISKIEGISPYVLAELHDDLAQELTRIGDFKGGLEHLRMKRDILEKQLPKDHPFLKRLHEQVAAITPQAVMKARQERGMEINRADLVARLRETLNAKKQQRCGDSA
eukprot:GHVN01096557.1.p1 GENE.GHVN01096557.1~~GHVN01096557.1.p1  ORF type:complete len:1147 (+),score=130.18 GHVN01096557.1:555-3995(+)